MSKRSNSGVFVNRSARLFMAACLSLGLLALTSHDVKAAVRSSSLKVFTLNLTVKNGQNKTFLLVSKSGRTLDSVKVTQRTKSIVFKTDDKNKVSSIAGTTIQIVSSRGGDYYGPVVLGWKVKSTRQKGLASATTVYTKLKASTALKINLGTVTIANARANGKQGYGKPSANLNVVDRSPGAAVRAVGGKPKGVGTYGKATTQSQEVGPFSDEIGVTADDPDPDSTLGGDKDDDGLPNAFDVNDDGDSKIDSADADTPAPQADIEDATTGLECAPIEFRIFTNFKATDTRFAGTLNAYGVDSFQATKARSAAAITRSMTMVFSDVETVCGSPVVKTELKGIGVPYAPSDYAELKNVCGNTGDYQFSIGSGKVCQSNGPMAGPDEFALTGGYDFESEDTLPSGQDTFQIKLTTADGDTYEVTSSAGFVFVTHPMVVAYGTDPRSLTPVDYTDTDPTPGPEGPRLRVEPTISIADGQTLYVEIYRPQRLAIDGETGGDFYDLGGFRYTPDIPNYPDSGPRLGKCDVLTTVDGLDGVGFSSDQASNPASPPTLVLAWNLSTCLTAKGISWSPDSADFDIQVEPAGPGGNSAQKVRVILE